MNDREKLIELLENSPSLDTTYGDYELDADWLIANGVVVREKGEWTTDGFCEFCKEEVMTEWDECGGEQKKTNFCPNCGADMRIELALPESKTMEFKRWTYKDGEDNGR